MKVYRFISIFLILHTSAVFAQQQTITISTGTKWDDAMIFNSTKPGHEHTPNNNYSTASRLSATAWTQSGNTDYRRTLLKFDLSEIPQGAVVQNATLHFDSDPTVTSGSAWNGNSPLSGSNAFYLEKITQNWDQGTVTWNNQPNSTTTDRIWIGPSTSTTENIAIDLQNMVQNWIDAPSTNFGLKMFLDTEFKWHARNYASTNHPNTSIHPKLVITYETSGSPISNAYRDDINNIFENVDSTPINTGLLADYGFELADVSNYNGVVTDTNRVDMGTLRLLYASVFSMKFNSNATLVTPDQYNQLINNYLQANPNTVPISGFHISYQQFKSDATSFGLTVSNNRLYAGNSLAAYEQRNIFAASVTNHILKGGNHQFILPATLFISNSDKTIDQIRADFDDGIGYRNITFNTPNNINYTLEGRKTLKVEILYTDNTILHSHSDFFVKNIMATSSSARYLMDTVGFNLTAHRAFTGDPASGWITIGYSGSDQVLDRPLIVAEGFDPENTYDYLSFIRGRTNGGIRSQVTGGTLRTELEQDGYDIVFINYDNGIDYIQNNAYLMQRVIEWVNNNKVGTEPNVCTWYEHGRLGSPLCVT